MRLKTNTTLCLMRFSIILVAVLGLTTKGNAQASCPSYSSATPPPPYDACVQAVFTADPFCCNTTWDAFCQGAYDPAPCAGGGGTIINMPVSGTINTCNASFFDSGGSAGSYLNNENRTITICPDNPGDLVQVNFSSFNLESGFDFLTIYDGNSAGAPIIGTFTGTTSPGIITSSSADGCLTFQFTSDGSVTAAGWAATILCATPSTTLDMPVSGSFLGCGLSFFDSGGPGTNYLNSDNRTVTLCPASSTDRIQITFNSFNLENNFDFLSIYDGTTTGATLLGTFTGATLPPVITATNGTGCLTFQFTSDGSVTAAGWQSSIACVAPVVGGPVVAGDCSIAANVCTDLSFSVDPSGFGAIDELDGNNISNPTTNPNGVNSGCLLSGELNSTWMIVNIASNGTLQFSFGADGGINCYDWMMWEYTPTTCNAIINNTLAPLACNWNGNCESFTGMASPLPAGGDASNFETPLNVSCGEQYLILFSNYSSALTSVPLNFFGSASVACGVFNPVTVNSPTVCVGQCAALTATGANTYTWAPSADLSTTTGPNTTACPGAAGTYTYAVTGTGNCGVGSTSATVTVLPSNDPICIILNTKLREFKGFLNPTSKEVELLWQTETEHNTDWFVVEKSLNGQDFSELKRLKAAGSSNYVLNYSTIDPDPSPIVTYYRLRLIHTDGVVLYSDMIAIEGKEGSASVSVFPNPADNEFIVLGSELENAKFSLINALGQSFPILPTSYSGQKAAFDVTDFSPGLYYVVVSANGISKIQKLIIE